MTKEQKIISVYCANNNLRKPVFMNKFKILYRNGKSCITLGYELAETKEHAKQLAFAKHSSNYDDITKYFAKRQ